jgi:hypothetical protein
MKKIIRLTESDLGRIVKRVINENMANNDLYKGISEVLWNSNASNDEQIAVLKYILNQKEGKGWVTKEKANPLFTGDLSGLEKLVKRTNRLGIDEQEDENLPNYVKIYHMYKNGEVSKKDFYAYMGILEKHERQGLIGYIESQKN